MLSPIWRTIVLTTLLTVPGKSDAQVTPTTREQLETLSGWITNQNPKLAARELPGFMLKAEQEKAHLDQIDTALGLMEALQNREVGTPNYGNFVWFYDENGQKPNDLNAVEFTMENTVLLWNLYRDQFTPAQRDRLKTLLEVGLQGAQNQPVGVDYANIFLLKTWNFIAIGEALGKPEVAAEGYRMLDQWIDYTRKYGIKEYLSPTYIGVDIDGLALISKYAGKAEGRKTAEAALDYIWACVRANWFDPAGRLGGAHSRDYDYLHGHGYLDRHAVNWGLIPSATLLSSELYANQNLTGWKPTAPDSLAVASTVPRFVWLRFGEKPWQHATQYIGRDISLGVAGVGNGPEDKVLAINFGGDPTMPMGSYVMDGRGDPFGQKKIALMFGHIKAHHLVPFTASAQVGSSVMFFSSYGPFIKELKGEAPTTSLSSNLVLPDAATVWQGGSVVADNGALNSSQPIFIRYQQTAIGLRVIDATDDKGKPIDGTLHRDGAGFHVQRPTWMHAAQAPTGEAHLLFLATAAEGLDDAGFAQFQKQFAAGKSSFTFKDTKLSAQAEAPDHSALMIEADITSGERKSSTPDYPGILRVNGTEVGLSILSAVMKTPAP